MGGEIVCNLMPNQKTALIVDDQTILLDGCQLVGMNEVAAALAAAHLADPDFLLVIGSQPEQHYKGIGTVIYASQRAGMPIDNLRFTTASGEVLTREQLRAMQAPPA